MLTTAHQRNQQRQTRETTCTALVHHVVFLRQIWDGSDIIWIGGVQSCLSLKSLKYVSAKTRLNNVLKVVSKLRSPACKHAAFIIRNAKECSHSGKKPKNSYEIETGSSIMLAFSKTMIYSTYFSFNFVEFFLALCSLVCSFNPLEWKVEGRESFFVVRGTISFHKLTIETVRPCLFSVKYQ